MYANLFFLKYYIAYASVLLSKFRNHPVVFLVVAACFTTIKTNIRAMKLRRPIQRHQKYYGLHLFKYLISSLLHGRFSVVTKSYFHLKRLCSRLLFKRRESNLLLCRASLLRLLNAHFTLIHEWICHPPETWQCLFVQ